MASGEPDVPLAGEDGGEGPVLQPRPSKPHEKGIVFRDFDVSRTAQIDIFYH